MSLHIPIWMKFDPFVEEKVSNVENTNELLSLLWQLITILEGDLKLVFRTISLNKDLFHMK